MGEETKKDKILDKIINFWFSNDLRKGLVLVFILGVALRFIVSSNISSLGDEAIHGPHAIGFLHSGLLSTIVQSPLWFYLTDIFFKILGVTIFSTRFLSFMYGSLSILVVYLISSKIFNRKIGILSSFFLAVSYYTIKYTLAEMDLSALFFLLLAVYLFIVSHENGKFPYLAAVCIGIASLIKTLSLYFVPAFLIAFLLFDKQKLSKKIKNIFFFGFIILFFFSPVLVHNYLWYKDKGLVDIYFAQYFGIEKSQQAYQGIAGYDAGFSYFILKIPQQLYIMLIQTFLFTDPIIFIAGLLGFFLAFYLKEDKKYLIFLLLFELIGLGFLLMSTGLQTHYTTLVPVFCIFAGFALDSLTEKVSQKFKGISKKSLLTIFLIVILLLQLYFLMPHLTSKAGTSKLREYAANSMDKNSVVIADARIYRGRIVWLFHDFHYLESSYFMELLKVNQNLSGQKIPVTLYFAECAIDDCGWGTIGSQPDFNESVENIVQSFSSIQPEKLIYGGGYFGNEGNPNDIIYKVYKTQINLNPSLISIIDSTHDWFYYPVNYTPKEKIFDQYKVRGFFDTVLYLFAWLMIIVSILFSILAVFIPIISLFPFITENNKTLCFFNNLF